MPCCNPIHRRYRLTRHLSALAPLLILAACGTTPKAPPATEAPAAKSTSTGKRSGPVLPPAGSGRGAYYKDDGPGDVTPEGLLDVPDAIPNVEPYSRTGNKPYVVFGKTYTPLTDDRPFKQRGIGSWYGKKFHQQKTSSGELYDMYKMTAAHPTLPIPSYARVTNLKTGAQVIVRVNDRGPFHSSRIIDLSYTAALKLGYLGHGSGELEVERLLPADILAMKNQTGPSATISQVAPVKVADNVPPVVAAEPVTMPALVSQPLLSAESTASAPADSASATANGFYLQFGAYSQHSNADSARERLMRELSGVVGSLDSIAVNGVYRLYAGPYSSRSAADQVLQQVRLHAVAAPIIVQR
ncbi:septal ring lytic transglycosylase RlpA family protein [Paraherbaspirillum soli]|uniref:Endolytic peptidoglycan transglycosylase RlpA n=1 Tax=Paraherbaspirillum soli TaxID=631222 RepID=A0ABW0M8L3_9BURK